MLTTLPAALTQRTVQTPIPYKIDNQVVLWDNEVSFYHRLLTWSLFSCLEEKRPVIESLIVQLDELRNVCLPALKEKLSRAQNPSDDGLFHHYWQEATEMRDYYSYFDQRLNTLKSKIFKGYSEFGHIQIW